MENLEERIARLEAKIDAVHTSVEKSRKYLLTMLIVTLLMIGLPLILAALVLPAALSSLSGVYSI